MLGAEHLFVERLSRSPTSCRDGADDISGILWDRPREPRDADLQTNFPTAQ